MYRLIRHYNWGLLTLLLLIAPAVYADKADEYFESAQSYFYAGDMMSARIELANALQLRRRHLPARLLLGRVELELGRPLDAEAQLELALDFGGDADLIMPYLGRTWLQTGRAQQITEYEKYRYFSNDSAAVWYSLRGRAFMIERDYARAIGEFERAEEMNPRLAEASAGMGYALLAMGEVERAEESATRALTLAPSSDDALKLEGDIALRRSEAERALEYYSRAVQENPRNLGARHGRAAMLIADEQFEPAMVEVDIILEQSPNDARGMLSKANILAKQNKNREAQELLAEFNFHLSRVDESRLRDEIDFKMLRALTLYLQGSPAQALPFLEEAYRAYPDKKHLRHMLIDAYAATGRNRQIVQLYDKVKNTDSGDVPHIYTYTRAAWSLGRHAEAERKLSEWAQQDPELYAELSKLLAVTLYSQGKHEQAQLVMADEKVAAVVNLNSLLLLGTIQLEQNLLDDARKTAQALSEAHADDSQALNFACLVYRRREELDRALDYCARAIKAAPQAPGPVVNLALVQSAMGDYDKAAYGFNAVLRMFPEHEQALGGMAHIARQKQEWELAMRYSERLTAYYPNNVDYRLQLAEDLLKLDRPEAALAEADRAENLSPLDARAIVLRASVYQQLGDVEAAATQLRFLSVDYDDTNPDGLPGLARQQLSLNLLEDGAATIKRMEKHSPDARLVAILEGELALRQGDAKQCVALVSPLPADTAPRLLSRCYVATKQYAEAARVYDRLLAEQPREDVAIERFKVNVLTGQPQKALGGLSGFLEQHPDSPAAVKTLADFALSYDLQEAERRYRQILEQWPEHRPAEVNNNLANLMLLADGRGADALSFAETAYELAPDNAGVADTLGWALVRNQRAAEGLKFLREAYFRESRSAEIRFHLAVALADLERWGEAREHANGLDRSALSNAQVAELDQRMSAAVN